MPSTCTVQAPHCGDAAAELGAGQAERIAQHPEQRRVRLDVDLMGLTVDLELHADPVLGWLLAATSAPIFE